MTKMIVVDVAELPKNMNGFRTTHTCELCGYEPRTKNKYREKQDHLVMKHFKEKIDKIFPHCRPYACPAPNCQFTGKDKQALLRHYTGKHGILERYLREALAERGINYIPHEGGKRRHSDSSNSSTGSTGVGRSAKNPRLSLTPPQNGGGTVAVVEGTTELIKQEQQQPQLTLPSKPTSAEELRKEVEAMMRSFQPVIDQPVTVLQIPPSVISSVNGSSVTVSLPTTPVTSLSTTNTNSLSNGSPMVTAIPVVQAANSNGNIVATANSSSASVVPVASLPAIVLSAVANATAATTNNGTAVSLPTQPTDVPTINVSSPVVSNAAPTVAGTPVILQQQQNNNKIGAPIASLIANGPSASSLPLPLEVISNGNLSGGKLLTTNGDLKLNGVKLNGVTNGASVTSILSNGGTTSPSPLNDDVMWSAVNSAGPAVVVEAANTLPIAYVADPGSLFTTNGASNSNANGTASIETIDYDYLYPASTCGSGVGGGVATNDNMIVSSATQRQLDFYAL